MSRTLSEVHKEHYEEFYSNLATVWSIEKKSLGTWAPLIKPLHKKILSLSCAASVIGGNTKSSEYIYNIAEASHLSLVLSLKGLQSPAYVLLRQTIELALKHIYFLTHPTEYSWTLTRIDYKELTFQYLIEYLKKTDEYRLLAKDRINNLDISECISYCYHILSRYVHVHSKDFMGYKTLTTEMGVAALKKLDESTKELWPSLLIVLTIFSPSLFIDASVLEQKLIRYALPQKYKDLLNTYLLKL
jgi:hypothetical protein